MRRLQDLLKRFRRDESGSFLVIFALLAIVLIATSGAVVDFTYTQTARSRAQTAIDAAALALQPKVNAVIAGTIVVNTGEHFLYFVLGGGKALRYGIGTAKTGFEWSGTHRITNKREWPDWTPPKEMLARRPDIPTHMEGGINTPLGARALYIGSTLYRIHGTTEPWTIGGDVSSGCIRMVNDDVIDLYGRVKIGAKVIVL